MTDERLTTSEVARRAGVNLQTVRYYERCGYIAEPPRTRSGYRQYEEDSVTRIRFIKRAQELGFSLEEIDDLLSLYADPAVSSREVKRRAEAKIADVEARIRDLSRIKCTLEELTASCSGEGAARDCSILRALGLELPAV